MNVLRSMAVLGLALLMASCSLTQQVESDAPGSSDAQSLTKRGGNLFNTRGRKVERPEELKQKDEEKTQQEEAVTATPAPAEAETAPVPTEAQQNAAHQLLAETPAPAAEPATLTTPTPEEVTPPAAWPPAGHNLRLGSIAPMEEAASAADAPPPGANTVELHGLRSPRLPKGLPMNIDGKLNNQN